MLVHVTFPSELPDIVPNAGDSPEQIGGVRDGARTAAELLLHLSVTATLTLSTTISLHAVATVCQERPGLAKQGGLTNLCQGEHKNK